MRLPGAMDWCTPYRGDRRVIILSFHELSWEALRAIAHIRGSYTRINDATNPAKYVPVAAHGFGVRIKDATPYL